MKTIGLLGGMSWESTVHYYNIINQEVKSRLGGLHSAKIVLCSVDFAEIEELQHKGDWTKAGEVLAQNACQIQSAGADCLLICTNTMHKVADQVQNKISIPLLHIADATAFRVKQASFNKVGLLGTRFTMEQDFYCGRLKQNHELEVEIPSEDKRQIVHNVIYDELCKGIFSEESRAKFKEIIGSLVIQGAQGIILGCTEIGMLVKQEDSPVPLFDTARIHAEAAVEFALKGYP